jgi:plasmid stabilization system protein ParE
MATRRVIWTEIAVKQRRSILNYWAKRNGNKIYATKIIQITNTFLSEIVLKPDLFRTIDLVNVRCASMGNFSIYYKLTATNIIVLAFWDNRQNPEKLLSIISQNNSM